MLQSATLILWIALWVGCWGSIFRKAGYSFWWGILGVIPVIPLLWLALAPWPAEWQTGVTRANTREATEEDAYALLDKGSRLERKHEYEAALAIYERITAQWPSTSVANDAQIAQDGVRDTLRREAAQQERG